MKNRKSYFAFSFVVAIIICCIFSNKAIIGSAIEPESTFENGIQLVIIDAYYGDFDSDKIEDDIIVIAILDPEIEGEILAFLNLFIILPSGFKFKFSFQFEIDSDGSQLLVTITSYNTALESGWYTAKLSGVFIYDDMLYYTTSKYTFDPPTENGQGEPGVEISIASRTN